PEDILYSDCGFLQSDERAQCALPLIREARRNRQPSRQILRNHRNDGQAFWNELSTSPVLNEAHKLTYFIGIQKEVTRAVETRERVKELEAEVEHLKRLLATREVGA